MLLIQAVVKEARLSMLFDPNLSPRCTGIIAQKKDIGIGIDVFMIGSIPIYLHVGQGGHYPQ